MSACGDWNKEVWSYHTSAASTSLASGASANHLQVGYDHLQVPPWSGGILLGWRVHPRLVGRWQLWLADSGTLVVLRTRTTIGRRDFDVLGLGQMAQTPRRTADFITVFWDICQKTQKSFITASEDLFNWRYINMHIHSFILSFIHSMSRLWCWAGSVDCIGKCSRLLSINKKVLQLFEITS